VTAGDDVQARSDSVRSQRIRYLWATRYLPLSLLSAGLLYLLAFAYSYRSSFRNELRARWGMRNAQPA
jgi:hypothetical protein